MSRGYHTIYLGENVPIEDLNLINHLYKDITYVSYFTVKPDHDKLSAYLDTLYSEVIKNTTNSVRVLGTQLIGFNPKKLSKRIKLFNSIKDLVKDL